MFFRSRKAWEHDKGTILNQSSGLTTTRQDQNPPQQRP